ncbi:MAG: GNAT family N-acetyltransferase [Arenimonas sp.]
MSLRLIASLDEIAAADWDGLHDGSNPFVSHAFLSGLEQHQCLRARWGWRPQHAGWFEDGRLLAAAPAYIKENSHGEFVFDHAWAHAYARYGRDYYPKWLAAVPYSPVTGPRLLSRQPATRSRLLAAMQESTQRQKLSSLHFNFLAEEELDCFGPQWLARGDLQFQWQNNSSWKDFEEFLAALSSKKRKNLRAERQQVQRAGVTFRTVHGDEADDGQLRAMHGFYCLTQTEKGNQPALTLEFLRHLARFLPRQLVLLLAYRHDEIIAGALCLRGADTLYGRYWGASDALPGLHFETCYYQGIEYCLREGLHRFEPGAQGEHKLARGFLPVLTHSRHFVTDPQFADALRDWCDEERASILRYRGIVLEHSPFRDPTADRPAQS